jgi:hypothetical protein
MKPSCLRACLNKPGFTLVELLAVIAINNANGYDLWIQLVIGGKTNLISNWSQTVIINSPLP